MAEWGKQPAKNGYYLGFSDTYKRMEAQKPYARGFLRTCLVTSARFGDISDVTIRTDALSSSPMDDQTAILTAITEYREAFNTGDVDRLLSVFANSYTDMSFGVPSFFGDEAPIVLRHRIERLFAEYQAEMKISVIVVTVLGDTAYDFGWHILTLTSKSGGPSVTTRQRYMELWGKQSDGTWKIKFYMDNADLPPAMPDQEFAFPALAVQSA